MQLQSPNSTSEKQPTAMYQVSRHDGSTTSIDNISRAPGYSANRTDHAESRFHAKSRLSYDHQSPNHRRDNDPMTPTSPAVSDKNRTRYELTPGSAFGNRCITPRSSQIAYHNIRSSLPGQYNQVDCPPSIPFLVPRNRQSHETVSSPRPSVSQASNYSPGQSEHARASGSSSDEDWANFTAVYNDVTKRPNLPFNHRGYNTTDDFWVCIGPKTWLHFYEARYEYPCPVCNLPIRRHDAIIKVYGKMPAGYNMKIWHHVACSPRAWQDIHTRSLFRLLEAAGHTSPRNSEPNAHRSPYHSRSEVTNAKIQRVSRKADIERKLLLQEARCLSAGPTDQIFYCDMAGNVSTSLLHPAHAQESSQPQEPPTSIDTDNERQVLHMNQTATYHSMPNLTPFTRLFTS